MDSDGVQLLKGFSSFFFPSFFLRLFAPSILQTSCSNNIVRMRGNTSRVSCMSEKKNKKPPRADSFCSTRLSSATQFALSVSPQYLSILIDVMDPIFFAFFFIYSPAAAYKTGFLINSASWVSNCHLPVMKINAACLI